MYSEMVTFLESRIVSIHNIYITSINVHVQGGLNFLSSDFCRAFSKFFCSNSQFIVVAGGYIVQNYLAKNYDTWEKSGLLIQVGRLGLSQQKL